MSTVTSTPAANAYTSSSQYSYLNGTYFLTPFHLQQPPLQPYIGPAPAPSPVAPTVYSAPAAIPGVYSLPQYQQAQQLFQKVAQTITPEAIENVKAALASSEIDQNAEAKKKAVRRKAAGQTWEDPTLADWPEYDFWLFCGNLGNEVNYGILSKAFSRFPSFNMARVMSFESRDLLETTSLPHTKVGVRFVYILPSPDPTCNELVTSSDGHKGVGEHPQEEVVLVVIYAPKTRVQLSDSSCERQANW